MNIKKIVYEWNRLWGQERYGYSKDRKLRVDNMTDILYVKRNGKWVKKKKDTRPSSW